MNSKSTDRNRRKERLTTSSASLKISNGHPSMRHACALSVVLASALLVSLAVCCDAFAASTLKSLAAAKFAPLTQAEARMLDAASAGKTAWCGPSDNLNDATNDPSKAGEWSPERTIRAAIIRWLCVDAYASKAVSLSGISVVGARVPEKLDLSLVRIDFPLGLKKCAIPSGVAVESAETRSLNFGGSWLGPIHANGLITHGDLSLIAFHGDGAVELDHAKIDGSLFCQSGVIQNSELKATAATIQGDIRFNAFQTDKLIDLSLTKIGGNLSLIGAQFKGNAASSSGLQAVNTEVGGALAWIEIGQKPSDNILLDLTFARVGALADDEASWPKYILMNEFVYGKFDEPEATPKDLTRRLKWLSKQPEFRTQPYLQLAKIFSAGGQDDFATQVLIERDKQQRAFAAGHRDSLARCCMLAWSWLLRSTVGYGYEPSRALGWGAVIVAIGWLIFCRGYHAGLIVPSARDAYEALKQTGHVPVYYVSFNSFVYSLETFLPVVDLRQGRYWSVRSTAAGEHSLFARVLPWYLRFQILAGWLLSTALIAGLSGLLHKA